MLHADQVAFQYPQNGKGLRPTSLKLQAGESVLVTGASGSGKSTFARCLTGLIPHLYHGKFNGNVRLEGEPVTEMPLWRLADQIGLVFQNPAAQMLAPTVEDEIIFGLENLGLDADAIRQRLEAVLEQFELSHLRHRSPQTLSGGEQQKLALAAIIARQPSILVFDEPLSMLDTNAVADFVRHVRRLTQEGRTAVICEHRKEGLLGLSDLRRMHMPGRELCLIQPPDLELAPTADFRLSVRDLSVRFGDRLILPGVSFDAQAGELIAILGRNGVGKTTLLRALTGFQKSQGDIAVKPQGQESSPDFGIVYQNPDLQLFNPSVREEILYRLDQPDENFYNWLLDALGLRSYEDWPPLLLSEGEKKRVALATVLMHKPRHGVLLDEPSLGQDDAHKEMLIRLLRNLTQAGKLVIMTTHDLALAAQVDRVILLASGGIAADGPPDQVLHDQAAWDRAGMVLPSWMNQVERELQP